MARLSIAEKLRIAAISAGRRRRGVVSQAFGLPPVRWLRKPQRADQLLIVPQDLRSADPSFWYEVKHGQFGLAGSLARLDGHSPFDLVPPGLAWERALHGFGWLRHLHAADEPEAAETARRLAIEWTIRNNGGHDIGWQPEILARRLISWISHSALLLEDADEQSYDIITRSLGAQLLRLSSAWRETPAGHPRLLALTALVLADLSIAGRDRSTAGDLRLFLDELGAQVQSDGSHASRNAAVVVELLLDLLPLKECFRSRGRMQPDALAAAITAMLEHVKAQRLGDGLLARFNGVGITRPASVATVLGYGDLGAPLEAAPAAELPASGYVRLLRGDTTLIADCAAPPPLELAGEACAGCLSFELDTGACVLIINSGMPGSGHADWRAVARSTAGHNTLVLGETSSSRLIRNGKLEALLGHAPIRGPAQVRAETIDSADGAVGFAASHDGYLDQFGMLHHRQIVLDQFGRRMVGTDRLKPPRGTLRLKRDVPFSIHFHLHPEARCQRAGKVGAVDIEAADQRWQLIAEGARVSIEQSTFFADTVGPLEALQIVLRGTTFGDTEVRWALTRVE